MTHKEVVLQGLKRNIEMYGKPYCPCKPSFLYSQPDADDLICKCKAYREQGICCCGLFEDKIGECK